MQTCTARICLCKIFGRENKKYLETFFVFPSRLIDCLLARVLTQNLGAGNQTRSSESPNTLARLETNQISRVFDEFPRSIEEINHRTHSTETFLISQHFFINFRGEASRARAIEM